MYLSLSDRSQQVMGLARTQRGACAMIDLGTEHILLGIVSESSGANAGALAAFSITLDRVRSGVEVMIGIGPPSASSDDRGVTPRVRQVIRFARDEAAQRKSPPG